jgi:hypothetical protein
VSRAWPPPPAWIELTAEPRRVRRGGTVEVTARVLYAGYQDREIGLVCVAHHAALAKTTDGVDPGGRFRMNRQTVLSAEWRPLGTHTFEVPADMPYSYAGDLLSFYWGIWVREEPADRPEGYLPLAVEP